MDADYSLHQFSFVGAVLVAGYLTVRVILPPNRTPTDRAWRNDSLWFASSTAFINLAALAMSSLILHHAVLSASPAAVRTRICPSDVDAQRNPALFTWSAVTAASLLAILVGAPLRLGAFGGLGDSFTFGLARPRGGLVTTGLYAHVQHPSYTGMWLVAAGSCAVFLRLDGGAAACFIVPVVGERWWEVLQSWSGTLYAGTGVLVMQQLATRVRQEEAMLRELFGKEWEEWHARTKRFVPGLF